MGRIQFRSKKPTRSDTSSRQQMVRAMLQVKGLENVPLHVLSLALDAALEQLTTEMHGLKGEEVIVFAGLGTFKVKNFAKRRLRNFDGTYRMLPKRRSIRFIPAPGLRREVK